MGTFHISREFEQDSSVTAGNGRLCIGCLHLTSCGSDNSELMKTSEMIEYRT